MDECAGYLTEVKPEGSSTVQYVCGVCRSEVCRRCLCVKTKKHKCDPTIRETVKMLKKDTKPCPNCAEGIFKIEGCDQMFCTQCHTAFSWSKGTVIMGTNVHNPHYFEWLRNRGQNREEGEQQDPCGFTPEIVIPFVTRITKSPKATSKNQAAKPLSITKKHKGKQAEALFTAYRLCFHLQGETIPKLLDPENNKRIVLRSQFLLGQITEDKLKNELQKFHKKKEKEREFATILQTYFDVMRDLFFKYSAKSRNADAKRPLYKNKKGAKTFDALWKEVAELRKFANTAFKKCAAAYVNKPLVINSDFSIPRHFSGAAIRRATQNENRMLQRANLAARRREMREVGDD